MLVKNNKETTMKFKSVAAALLAAVTIKSPVRRPPPFGRG